jgi:hypothetical protein
VASNFTSTGTLESSPLLVPANIALNSYEITVPITANQSIGKFWFVLDEHDGSGPQTLDNGGDGYLFPQDEVITVYELGFTSPVHNDVSLSNFTFVTGVRLLRETLSQHWYAITDAVANRSALISTSPMQQCSATPPTPTPTR